MIGHGDMISYLILSCSGWVNSSLFRVALAGGPGRGGGHFSRWSNAACMCNINMTGKLPGKATEKFKNCFKDSKYKAANGKKSCKCWVYLSVSGKVPIWLPLTASYFITECHQKLITPAFVVTVFLAKQFLRTSLCKRFELIPISRHL